MTDLQMQARFRIMMLIAELQELAEASADGSECERVESVLLSTIEALGEKPSAAPQRLLMHITSPGRA